MQAVGIDVQTTAVVTFAIAAALAGLAAILYVPLITILPTMGQLLIVKAFVVIIMGGLGRVDTTILAAFLLGEVEALTTQFVSASFVDAFAFMIMIATLFFRPFGLFGKKVGI